MNILMIAPEPYFEPRGTPFSEYYRIKALSSLGHTIDLVTYPLGEDRLVDGLTIYRSGKIWGMRSVKTGPSMKKILLDITLMIRVLRLIVKKRYDLIHTHEEASILGVIVSKLTRTPHLYDMHSSLVQQLENFQFSRSRWLKKLVEWMEKKSLRNAHSVIVICRSLFTYAASLIPHERLTLIENFIDETPDSFSPDEAGRLRARYNPQNKKMVVYTGTLEPYQGIPLLIDTMERLPDDYELLIIGGTPDQVEEFSKTVEDKGLLEKVRLLGQKRAEEIPIFLHIADVLVSPRSSGTNIPLKIYSYLKSGVPLVATNLYTHTQTLTDEIAFLADPNPESMAECIFRASGPEGKEISAQARWFCREHYTWERYRELVAESLRRAGGACREKRIGV